MHRAWPLDFLCQASSVELPTYLFTRPLPCQRFFCSALITRLQVKGVFFDVLDNVFLLNLTLESAKGTLDRLTVLNSDFCQLGYHPFRH